MRIPAVVAEAVMVASGAPFEAVACSCEPPPPPQEALGQSVAVFSGTVTGIEEWATANDGPFFKVTLPAMGLCTRTRPLEEAQDDLVALRRPTAVSQTLWGRLKALLVSRAGSLRPLVSAYG